MHSQTNVQILGEEQSDTCVFKGADRGHSTPTYLTHLNMGVLYGVGVTFDQLFHLPQVGLLDFLKLLLARTCNKQHSDKRETLLPWKPPESPLTTFILFVTTFG